jgi:hypothetical protein
MATLVIAGYNKEKGHEAFDRETGLAAAGGARQPAHCIEEELTPC